jgi:hypothetical protein
MKWNYKNCDVEVTVIPDMQTAGQLTPIVEIDGKTVGSHRMLSTNQSFSTAELAEQHGLAMARDWIDQNLGDS